MSAGVELASIIASVRAALAGVSWPAGPPRRVGVEPGELAGRVESVAFYVDGRVMAGNLMSFGGAVLELGSLLFAAGAPGPAWRPFIAAAAGANALDGQLEWAGQFGAVARDWALVEALPPGPLRSQRVEANVLWSLLGGTPERARPTLPLDPAHVRGGHTAAEIEAWVTFATALPAGDFDGVERALAAIADEGIDFDEECEPAGVWHFPAGLPHWRRHYRGYAPDFAPAACAAAAIARRRGYVPRGLSEAQAGFLEAGLGDP